MISHQMLSDAFTNDKTKIIPNLHSLTFIEMYVKLINMSDAAHQKLH